MVYVREKRTAALSAYWVTIFSRSERLVCVLRSNQFGKRAFAVRHPHSLNDKTHYVLYSHANYASIDKRVLKPSFIASVGLPLFKQRRTF